MTTLINLESYLECCRYAYLFKEDPEKLVPNPNGLPLTYRDFCNRHQSQSFLPLPAMKIAQPTALIPRQSQLPQQNIGLTLSDDSSERIFIVREANSLVLRSLQSRYIYANVYRYWSYVEQLQQFTNLDRPLVIYDLDSFTPAQITPLTFEHHCNASYPIPIIDTRSLKQYDALKLSKSYEDIYDSVVTKIAKNIVNDLGIDSESVVEVSKCIKKIGLFQSVEFSNFEAISLILEINDRFYTYSLSTKNLEDIVYGHLPVKELQRVINKNQDYNFVLLSSYTKLAGVKQGLQQAFNSTLFIPGINSDNFSNIWQQKIDRPFPLFGQHLERISFFVKKEGAKIELSLPEKICYEGEKEVIASGQYYKNEKLEQNFPLTQKEVDLQFWINGEPFLDNETDKEQIYKIENQYFDENPTTDIEIRFRLKPGLEPKLEVLDRYRRVLNSSLVECALLSYVSMDQIVQSRNAKSEEGIKRLSDSLPSFNDDLQSLTALMKPGPIRIRSISDEIRRFRSSWSKKLLPIFTLTENHQLDSVYRSYSSMERGLESLFKQLTLKRNTEPYSKKLLKREAHCDLLLILGDSYSLANQIDLNFIFDADVLSKPKNEVSNWVDQLCTAAKVASSKTRQELYLNLFSKSARYREKDFYQTNEYIWGYARLLLWYVDLNDKSLISIYSQNFTSITTQCLSLNPHNDKSYIRDALIALIYLLTFREVDSQFVEVGCDSYKQAKKLCDKLKPTPILSRKANIDMPLNYFFEQLLDGSATQEQVSNMIEID